MIRLYAEGQQIDLSKENFTLERYNPLMDFGVVRGARVLNFTLPATDRNSRIFGYINNPQTPLPRIRLKASIRFFELEAEKVFWKYKAPERIIMRRFLLLLSLRYLASIPIKK